jgi:hypothetical protein
MLFPLASAMSVYQRLIYFLYNFLYAGPSNGQFYKINRTRNLFLAHNDFDKRRFVEFMRSSGYHSHPAMESYDHFLKSRAQLRYWLKILLVLLAVLFLVRRMFRYKVSIYVLTCLVAIASTRMYKANQKRETVDRLAKQFGLRASTLTRQAVRKQFRRISLHLYVVCRRLCLSSHLSRHPDRTGLKSAALQQILNDLMDNRDLLLSLLPPDDTADPSTVSPPSSPTASSPQPILSLAAPTSGGDSPLSTDEHDNVDSVATLEECVNRIINPTGATTTPLHDSDTAISVNTFAVIVNWLHELFLFFIGSRE